MKRNKVDPCKDDRIASAFFDGKFKEYWKLLNNHYRGGDMPLPRFVMEVRANPRLFSMWRADIDITKITTADLIFGDLWNFFSWGLGAWMGRLKELQVELDETMAAAKPLMEDVHSTFQKGLDQLAEHMQRVRGIRMSIGSDQQAILKEMLEVLTTATGDDFKEMLIRVDKLAELCERLSIAHKEGWLDKILEVLTR